MLLAAPRQVEKDPEALYLPAARRNPQIASRFEKRLDEWFLISRNLGFVCRLVFAPEFFDRRLLIELGQNRAQPSQPPHVGRQISRQGGFQLKPRRAFADKCERNVLGEIPPRFAAFVLLVEILEQLQAGSLKVFQIIAHCLANRAVGGGTQSLVVTCQVDGCQDREKGVYRCRADCSGPSERTNPRRGPASSRAAEPVFRSSLIPPLEVGRPRRPAYWFSVLQAAGKRPRKLAHIVSFYTMILRFQPRVFVQSKERVLFAVSK